MFMARMRSSSCSSVCVCVCIAKVEFAFIVFIVLGCVVTGDRDESVVPVVVENMDECDTENGTVCCASGCACVRCAYCVCCVCGPDFKLSLVSKDNELEANDERVSLYESGVFVGCVWVCVCVCICACCGSACATCVCDVLCVLCMCTCSISIRRTLVSGVDWLYFWSLSGITSMRGVP